MALLEATETLLHAVTAGRAARKASGLKVRQPLQALYVRSSTPGSTERLGQFEDELRDELNVKEIRYLDPSAGLVEYRFKPNLRVGRQEVRQTGSHAQGCAGSAGAAPKQRRRGEPSKPDSRLCWKLGGNNLNSNPTT